MNSALRIATLACACAMAMSGCDWFMGDEARIARAEKSIAAGQDRAAAIDLQKVLESKPDNVSARLLLVRISLRQGDVKGAEADLRRAIESHAPAREVAVLDAEILLAKGDYTGLLAKLESGDGNLDASQASIYRGKAQLARRNLEEAVAAFNAALVEKPDSVDARLGLAEALAESGNFDAGLAEIDKVVERAPGNAHAWSLKGRILGRRGEFKGSTIALDNARKNAVGQLTTLERSTLLASLIEAYIAAGDTKGARSTLDELSKQAPDSPLVHLLTAGIAMAEQNYSLAVTEAQKVVAAAPKHPMAKLLLGAALLANGNTHQAEAQLSEIVAQSPENLEARKLLADANLRLQRPDIALEVLAPAAHTGADPQVESLLARANLQRGDEAAAIELLQQSVAARPGDDALKLDLAFAYVAAGRHQDAIELLDTVPAHAGSARREQLLIAAIAKVKSPQAAQLEVERIVKANSKDTGVLRIAASFYAQGRNFARARELLRDAVALDPKNVSSLSSLARLEILAGDDTAARAALKSVLEVDPSSQGARISLAQLELRNQNAKSAIENLEAARGDDAESVEPRLLLATQYLRERKTSQADQILKELSALAEKNPAVAVATGRLYSAAGRYDEALSQFRAAVVRDPRNPSWLLELARAQLAKGDSAGARDSVKKALELDPDGVATNGMMVGIEMKDGHKELALARAARIRKSHPHSAGAAMLEGDTRFAQGDAVGASGSYADAYRLAPSSAAAIRTYQTRTAAKLEKSTAELTDWLQRQPQDLSARMVLAQSLLQQGRSAEAIQQYERVVAGGKPGAMALNNLAWLYQQADDPRAEATAKSAYDLASDQAAIADTYGWILVDAGKPLIALPILERAAAAPGATAEVRYHYATALAKGGRPDEARTLLRQLLAGPASAQTPGIRTLLKELGDAP